MCSPAIDDAGARLPRGPAADQQVCLRDAVRLVVAAVLDGEGVTAVEDRHAAFAGRADDLAVLAHFIGLVRSHRTRVTDADIERLRAAGLDDDAIFELTVAAPSARA